LNYRDERAGIANFMFLISDIGVYDIVGITNSAFLTLNIRVNGLFTGLITVRCCLHLKMKVHGVGSDIHRV